MNAILGIVRPGDMGVDLMHYNPHKTFSGPHGGGGPGAGPIAVRGDLAPFLPAPLVARDADGTFRLDYDRPNRSAASVSFFGNTGVLFRAYCYIRSQGPEGLKRIAENAVLNANYLMSLVKDVYPVPYGNRCMHEFVASARSLAKDRGIRAMDIAKRLIDFNFHAPTVYFPLIVSEALMIEPTETESRETLEAFAKVLLTIAAEDPEFLHDAPHTTPISRPDEVKAAKTPVSSGSSGSLCLLRQMSDRGGLTGGARGETIEERPRCRVPAHSRVEPQSAAPACRQEPRDESRPAR